MPIRPNILFITSHDIGQHLGCYGQASVRTPALDRLAAEGVRFAKSFCVSPTCSPSRAAIHTGRYPHSNGMLGLAHGAFAWDLNPNEVHLAAMLGEAGYRTSLIGIHHESHDPARCGFDQLDAAQLPAGEIASRVERFLANQRHQAQPFYLQVGFFEPHRPFDYGGAVPDDSCGIQLPPYLLDESSARIEIAAFQGAIHQLDQAVGRILTTLAQNGLAENTMVIFAADHGIPFPRAKCTLYDPGLEVALLLRWPARGWSGGRVLSQLVSNVDYLPTLLEALDLEVPATVQGVSQVGLLDGRGVAARSEVFGEITYHQYYDPLRCIRTPDYKLICSFATNPMFMNPTQSYRPRTTTIVPPAPEFAQHAEIELYDLGEDPREFVNVAHNLSYASQRSNLLARLHQWMLTTQDPLLFGVPISPHHRRVLSALSAASRSAPVADTAARS